MTRPLLFLFSILITCLSSVPLHGTDLTGKWTSEFDSYIGLQKYVFIFKTENDQLTGTASYDHSMGKGTATLQTIELEGDKVSFTESFNAQGMDLTITYQGTLTDQEIRLSRQVGDLATEQLVAKRAPIPHVDERGLWIAPHPERNIPILPALAAPEDTSFYSERDVPHGKVEIVRYPLSAGGDKQMHVYTPPGYEPTNSATRYPVLYLNHGGGENDSHWTESGKTNYILDNLIADGLARPMIVVMPNTSGVVSGNVPQLGKDDACTAEYLQDILPYVDSHYRTDPRRESRAIAGLSMGGFVTLNTGFSHLETFGELYVYSSGYWPAMVEQFEQKFAPILNDPAINEKFYIPIYFGVGETDIAMANSMKTEAVFARHGIRRFSVLSSHGHEWLNWRRYLHQTAQIMFPADR